MRTHTALWSKPALPGGWGGGRQDTQDTCSWMDDQRIWMSLDRLFLMGSVIGAFLFPPFLSLSLLPLPFPTLSFLHLSSLPFCLSGLVDPLSSHIVNLMNKDSQTKNFWLFLPGPVQLIITQQGKSIVPNKYQTKLSTELSTKHYEHRGEYIGLFRSS